MMMIMLVLLLLLMTLMVAGRRLVLRLAMGLGRGMRSHCMMLTHSLMHLAARQANVCVA